MKRFFLTLASLVLLVNFSFAGQWFTDYSKALAVAKSQNKGVLMDFTGSDWCGWCMKLDREVFDAQDFKDYAAQKLVLVKVDFPRFKNLPPAEAAQNDKLQEKYGIQYFPTIIVLKPDGNRAGKLGYTPGGPKAFIAEIEKLLP